MHKLSLTNIQVSKIRKVFANGSSANIKFSKTRLSKMIQSGVFLGTLLGPLLKAGSSLMKNVLKQLASSVLVLLGLPATASVIDAAIQKKNFGSRTTLAFSNEEIDDIMKITEALEKSGLLIKSVSEAVGNEVRKQKGGFIGTLAAALGSILFRNMLSGKRVVRGGDRVIRAGERVIRAGEGQDFYCRLIL